MFHVHEPNHQSNFRWVIVAARIQSDEVLPLLHC